MLRNVNTVSKLRQISSMCETALPIGRKNASVAEELMNPFGPGPAQSNMPERASA